MLQHLVLDKKPQSSFLSVEKDFETILRKLFIESRPYSDTLKRLLVINTKDCLTDLDNKVYKRKLDEMTLHKLRQEGYVKLNPKIRIPENEEIKSYLIISMDNFIPNSNNPYYRDCTVHFDIICHTDYWEMNDYQIRPLKIAGFIDGILNQIKLSGIGEFNFLACNELVLDEVFSGYSLSYSAIHGHDDKIAPEEE